MLCIALHSHIQEWDTTSHLQRQMTVLANLSTALHFAAVKLCSCHSWIVAAPANRTNSRYQNSMKPTHFCGNFTTFHRVFENSQVNFSFFVMPSMSSLCVQQAFIIIKVQSGIHDPRGKTRVWNKERRKKDERLEKDRLGEKKKSKRTYQMVRCAQGTTQKQKYFTQLYFHITDNGESFSAAFAWRSTLQQTQNNIIINYAHTRHNNLCSHSSLSLPVSHNFPHSHTQQK